MNDFDKLQLINTMKFIDDDADGENCSSVIVEDNGVNRDILHSIGVDDEHIYKELMDEDGYINVLPIAFRYSDWWSGEQFGWKVIMDYKTIVDKLAAAYLGYRNKKISKEEYDEIVEDTIRDAILQEPYYNYKETCKD